MKGSFYQSILIPILCLSPLMVTAEESPETTAEAAAPAPHFKPFTGRITGEKVRLRIRPQLDAHVVKELSAGDLFVITGETEDFYSVHVPKNVRFYVYRKYLIDDTVDGNRVNLRMGPSVESAIVDQLHYGDKVVGQVAEKNSKWMEIEPPDFIYFYVAKDYIDNVGGPELLLRLEKTKERLTTQLSEAQESIATELEKPFDLIQVNHALEVLEEIAAYERDFPKEATLAKNLSHETRQSYMQKKIHYLEEMQNESPEELQRRNEELRSALAFQEQKVKELVNQVNQSPTPTQLAPQSDELTAEMLAWEPIEGHLFRSWSVGQDPHVTIEDFYVDQLSESQEIAGVVQPYNHNLSTRPGDYLLFSEETGTPIAYLYSTRVNIKDLLGQKKQLRVVERTNHNFAFPAFYVLSVED